VWDRENDNRRTFGSRADAEDAAETVRELGVADVTVFPPGETPEDTNMPPQDPEPEPDGGTAEVVETVDADPVPADSDEVADLPERSVADDPLTWMPGDFIDEIDGSPAVNRKGFEVLSHFYDISVSAELQVAPDENGHEYARVKATAETPDGRTCEAFGSAHVKRGDDETLLLEMADTRARKRALSIATGVGAVAVEELKNEVDA